MLKPLLAFAFLLLAAAPAAALTPEELTPAEKKVYATLTKNPTSAQRYLITRDYLRKCEAILADPGKAISLPVQPGKLDERYLTADERARVDEAVDLNVAALISTSSLA